MQYFHAYGEAGTEQAIKKYAAAYDGAKVTTQWITGSNFESKLFASLLPDNAPDVFEFHPQIQLVRSGQVADLTDLVEPVRDDFNQADIRSHTVDGKVYGVRMIDDPQFPNSLNFFAAIATITFINGWNSFLWPLVIGQDPGAWTVQVALSSYMTNQTVNYHLIFMATALSLLPLPLVFLFLQRWLVQGIARTGIKG